MKKLVSTIVLIFFFTSLFATVKDTVKYVFKLKRDKTLMESIIREEKLFYYYDNNNVYLIFNPIFAPDIIITVLDEYNNSLTNLYHFDPGKGNVEIIHKRLNRVIFFFIEIDTDIYFIEIPKKEDKHEN